MSITREEAIEFVRDKLGIEEVHNVELSLSLLNKIARALLSEVPFQGQQFEDGWVGKFSFTLEPKDPMSAKIELENTFCLDPPSPFMSYMRVFRWPKDQESVVALRGQELIFFGSENNDDQRGEMRKQSCFVDLDQLEENILKYFPTIEPVLLQKAMPVLRNMKSISQKK